MAADLTIAGLTTANLGDAAWATLPNAIDAQVLSSIGTPLGMEVDMSSFSSGGDSGPPPRPTTGFLYPRGDY